jgi:hypothetical protein
MANDTVIVLIRGSGLLRRDLSIRDDGIRNSHSKEQRQQTKLCSAVHFFLGKSFGVPPEGGTPNIFIVSGRRI